MKARDSYPTKKQTSSKKTSIKIEKKNLNTKTASPLTRIINTPITACKRCKQKKIKCDKLLPTCAHCSKAKVSCISVDPATGEDVPRSYVLFLEDTLQIFLKKLQQESIDLKNVRSTFPVSSNDPPYTGKSIQSGSNSEYYLHDNGLLGDFLINQGHLIKGTTDIITPSTASHSFDNTLAVTPSPVTDNAASLDFGKSNKDINSLASIKETNPSSFLGDSSGVSFARLVFTATNIKPELLVTDTDGGIDKENIILKESIHQNAQGHINDTSQLPDKFEAQSLIVSFFSYTNVQLPILHREFFLKKYFEPIYGPWDYNISLLSDYTEINKSFNLPKNVFIDKDAEDEMEKAFNPWYNIWKSYARSNKHKEPEVPKRLHIPLFFLNIVFAIGFATDVIQSKISKVVAFKRRAAHYANSLFVTTDRLEALSGTLLLVIYALMRPNVPGVWYVLGSALRLTVDLGLHTEKLNMNYDPFTREMRRRLFWSVYSLDRQICSYFGRPFGIPEESITTRYPSMLDDSYIDTKDFVQNGITITDYSDAELYSISSKHIAISMFKIRKLQASIVRILYAPHSELPRAFKNIEDWRSTILEELDRWYAEDVPKNSLKMNCGFNTFVFDLNYHYSKLILFGISPKCPNLTTESFKVVFESSKGTIDVFHNLCINKKLSYTWVAVHNIFMTGMTYLYTIYYSNDPILKDEYDVLEYTAKVLNVLKELIGKCDSAKNCYQIYKTLAAVVKKLKLDDLANKTKDKEQYNLTTHNDVVPNSDYTDISLNQFFQEMEKFNTVPTIGGNNHEGISTTDDLGTETLNEPSLMNSLGNGLEHQARRGSIEQDSNMIDLLYQVSSQSIWDEFFVKSSSNDNAVPDVYF
ncbi:similar to Saccharomyces cerevisiae YLR014C PPR1 Zinc finger transcription factor containing a Zn(2)-Cys(6) binuclear cluster domain [Maudiozyma saulgeensis]|uniref:Similar to Saccharomyces cerevisiae YLR014C PPR1 Zinc finger transcription factor containing a Zn(2)-Cys(6) binuclear cluster domain n=1 Tax=Maudiozyma saulgeensis TaxID=1789683 RepID=A0A1X7R888_9SACH|nr:similar to Saccharomyces cerevisiae YLR014C PPR1 Zinc finger transcription factor containing a Zn(2)-Cys(6) binuclear cluster domain [Kazachstania saulgeensis]